MSNLLPTPRREESSAHTAQTYTYPDQFLYPETILNTLIGITITLAVIPALVSLLNYGTILPSALRAAIFLSITALSLLLFMLTIKKEIRNTTFTLTPSNIIHTTASRRKSLELSKVTALSLIRFPWGGGVIILESAHTRFTLSLFINGIAQLTASLQQRLAQAGAATGTTEEAWNRIHWSSNCSQEVTNRAQHAFKPLQQSMAIASVISLFVGIFFWDMPIIPLLLWTLSGPLFPLGSYLFADILLRRAYATNRFSDEPLRSSGNQRYIHIAAALAALLIYLVFGIVYKAMVM